MEGNERADALARSVPTEQETIWPANTLNIPLVASHALGTMKGLSHKHWAEAYAAAKGGKYTRDLDRALPGRHTKALYDQLTRLRAAILAQMRTGKCRLKSYLHAVQAADSIRCECGQKGTVKHVVLDCRLWTTERQELRAALEDKSRWGDMPYLLRGWSGRKDPRGRYIDGEASTWKPNMRAVKATIDFAAKVGRFSAE